MMREIEKSLLEHHCHLAAGKIHRSTRKILTSTRKKFKEIKFAQSPSVSPEVFVHYKGNNSKLTVKKPAETTLLKGSRPVASPALISWIPDVTH